MSYLGAQGFCLQRGVGGRTSLKSELLLALAQLDLLSAPRAEAAAAVAATFATSAARTPMPSGDAATVAAAQNCTLASRSSSWRRVSVETAAVSAAAASSIARRAEAADALRASGCLPEVHCTFALCVGVSFLVAISACCEPAVSPSCSVPSTFASF
eukprot:scaffold8030_cov417-Prasinococcus_capsulatus_cf.AAC.5